MEDAPLTRNHLLLRVRHTHSFQSYVSSLKSYLTDTPLSAYLKVGFIYIYIYITRHAAVTDTPLSPTSPPRCCRRQPPSPSCHRRLPPLSGSRRPPHVTAACRACCIVGILFITAQSQARLYLEYAQYVCPDE